MEYRIISLASKPYGVDEVGIFHRADWIDTRFRLKGKQPASEQTGRPLLALVHEAEQVELDQISNENKHLSHYLTGGKTIRGYLDDLYRGMTEPKLGDDSSVLPSREHLVIDRPLRSAVDRMRMRRTVFLVPDYWPHTLPLPKASPFRERGASPVDEFLQLVARELHVYIRDGVSTFPIGFMKLRRPASKVHTTDARVQQFDEVANHKGLMFTIMVELLSMSSTDMGVGFAAEGGPSNGSDLPEGPILFDGPTGTGKTLAAKLLALELGKELVEVNIASLTEHLLESRMRGYKKGSFTDAKQDEDGWFAKADGQVLFLDEFQNASLASQTQLLDLLEPFNDDVYVGRIGESRRSRYTVKVVIAVNKPVEHLLAAGVLREDLYYRFRTVVRFWRLREILKAKGTFAERAKMLRRLVLLYCWKSSPYWDDRNPERLGLPALFPEIDDGAIELIATAPWEGNFRELERVITDIHWKNYRSRSSSIGIRDVEAQLAKGVWWPDGGGRHASAGQKQASKAGSAQEISDLVGRLCSGDTDVQAGDARSWDRVYLEVVQDLLIMNRFNIEGTVAALKPTRINLGSRQSLRAFLRENLERLRPEIRAHEKIDRFLGGSPAL